jgi:hypothetical protein
MDEENRKLALKQAKGKLQKAYIKELLRGPLKMNRYWSSPIGESGISYWSRDTVETRLRDKGFTFQIIKMPSGNNYTMLVPPEKK